MDIFNLENWTEQDLNSLISNSIEESAYLEFKSAKALGKSDGVKDEIAKDVSAFANSDGGILIYGIAEKNHKADSLDFIDGDEFNKEWLELVITTGISRRIDGIVIFPVRFNNDIKQTVYVVKIPVSYSAPHMVNRKKKYYKRFNFVAAEMEEYEIRQTYGRKENAELKVSSVAVAIDNFEDFIQNNVATFTVSAFLENIGNVVANEYKLVAISNKGNQDNLTTDRNKQYIVSQYPDRILVSTSKPVLLYPNEKMAVLEFGVELNMKGIKNRKVIFDFKLYYGSIVKEYVFDISPLAMEVLNTHFERKKVNDS